MASPLNPDLPKTQAKAPAWPFSSASPKPQKNTPGPRGLNLTLIFTLARYEFVSFWSGAIGALAIIVFLGLEGLFFNNGVAAYALANLGAMSRGGGLDATLTMFSVGLADLGLLLALVSPLTTMRAFCASNQEGHLDLLLSWPLRRSETTLGLFLAAAASLALLTLLGLAPYALLLFLGVGNLLLLFSALIGLLLCVSAFAALGLAVSSYARKPMAAALTHLGILGFMYALGWVGPYLPQAASEIIQGLAFGPRLSHFTLGLVDFNDVTYFLTLMTCSLVLAKPVR